MTTEAFALSNDGRTRWPIPDAEPVRFRSHMERLCWVHHSFVGSAGNQHPDLWQVTDAKTGGLITAWRFPSKRRAIDNARYILRKNRAVDIDERAAQILQQFNKKVKA